MNRRNQNIRRHAAFAALADVLHPDLRPLAELSSSESIVLAAMVAACRAWLRYPPDRRPSARALGVRIIEIAESTGGNR